MKPKDLISISDTMRLLGVSRTKVWRLMKDGMLTPYSNPLDKRETLFRKAEVMSLIPQKAKVA